jgi:hypothetical protein
MPGTSVIAFSGPALPGNGIPRSRPRGLVWAVSGIAVAAANKSQSVRRIRVSLFEIEIFVVFRKKTRH